jgi:hypothetical protein
VHIDVACNIHYTLFQKSYSKDYVNVIQLVKV